MTATHPLGDVAGVGPTAAPDLADEKSIVDTMLDLDAFLSADVRLAERSFRLFTRPDLEARIDDLNAELDSLLDARGRPLSPSSEPRGETSVGDAPQEAPVEGRSWGDVAAELLEVQREYFANSSIIRLRAMDDVAWQAFDAKHGEVLRKGSPYPPDAIAALVSKTAAAPTAFTPAQVGEFRKRVGSPVMLELARQCFGVNTESGVSIPKSSISLPAMNRGPLG